MDRKQLTKEQIEKAANWWAKMVESEIAPSDNFHQVGVETDLTLDLLIDTASRPAGNVDTFKSVLADILSDDERGTESLGVDYHPCNELTEALERAGFSSALGLHPFVFKSYTWFGDDGSVKARRGREGAVVKL